MNRIIRNNFNFISKITTNLWRHTLYYNILKRSKKTYMLASASILIVTTYQKSFHTLCAQAF